MRSGLPWPWPAFGAAASEAGRPGLAPARQSRTSGVKVSVGSVLSFNRWAEFHPLETFGVLPGRTIYVVQDYVAANIFLPLGALLMALFVGWFASKDIWREQLATSARIFAVCWLPVMRFVVPPAIASIMVISMLG